MVTESPTCIMVRAAPKPVIVLLGTVWNTLSPVDTEYELPSFLPLMSSISYFVLTVEVDIGTRFFSVSFLSLCHLMYMKFCGAQLGATFS